MRHVLLTFMMVLSVSAFAKDKTRKVSNSSYFECNLERLGEDQKIFKRQYLFPFPTEKDETYEIKGSMRWNDYKVIFSQDGKVVIKISENIQGKKVEVIKEHQLGKEPQFDSFKTQVDLKDGETVIPYLVQCNPE